MYSLCVPEDVFTRRQGLAAVLKVKIDRADSMSETELAQLRTDIKVGSWHGVALLVMNGNKTETMLCCIPFQLTSTIFVSVMYVKATIEDFFGLSNVCMAITCNVI